MRRVLLHTTTSFARTMLSLSHNERGGMCGVACVLRFFLDRVFCLACVCAAPSPTRGVRGVFPHAPSLLTYTQTLLVRAAFTHTHIQMMI